MVDTPSIYAPATAPRRATRSRVSLVYWLWLASAPLSLALIALQWV